MSENKKYVDRPCRVCGKVPEDGYYNSKVLRSDWICPACSNAQVQDKRRKLENKGS